MKYINDMPLSAELKKACAENGFITLDELLNVPVEALESMPWLTASMLEELKTLVDRRGAEGETTT